MGAIQIKNVPDELHQQARDKAEARGLTLSQYLLDLIKNDLPQMTWKEWFDHLQEGPDISWEGETPAEAVRAGRAERDRQNYDPTSGDDPDGR